MQVTILLPLVMACLAEAKDAKQMALEVARQLHEKSNGYWKSETKLDSGMISITERFMYKDDSGKTHRRAETNIIGNSGKVVRRSILITNEFGTWKIMPDVDVALKLPQRLQEVGFEQTLIPMMDCYEYNLSPNTVTAPASGEECFEIRMTLDENIIKDVPSLKNTHAVAPKIIRVLISTKSKNIMGFTIYDKDGNALRGTYYKNVSSFEPTDYQMFQIPSSCHLVFSTNDAQYRAALLYYEQQDKISHMRKLNPKPNKP